MPRSSHHAAGLALAAACAGAPACAGQSDLIERDYPSHEFAVRDTAAEVELVHAAYLPRGVEFELRVRNASDAPIELEQHGILLSFQGLEYPLDASGTATLDEGGSSRTRALPETVTLAPGQTLVLHLPFRLGRALSETGWVVLRGLRHANGYAEPLWLEVPAVPSRLDVQPRKGGLGGGGRKAAKGR